MGFTSADITATGRTVNVRFEYEDPILQPYQRRASKRLSYILEQLDMGSDANLGYTKVTWLPDPYVQVRYLAMEGVLEPIIVVRVEFQPGITRQSSQFTWQQVILEEQEIEDPPIPPIEEPRYIPYAWIGIHAGNHQLISGSECNVNADYWGYPVDPRLYGFEPTIGGIGILRYFPDSVESFGGSLVGGATWPERAGFRADEQVFVRVNGGQDWQLNQFGLDQGTFQDSDWSLSTAGLVASSKSGMIALEHLDTFVTAPRVAYRSNIVTEGLPSNYWKRSIIIPGEQGVTFPSGAQSGIVDVGGGVTAAISATYSGGRLTSQILNGKYEIGAYCVNWHCEATTADLHIRVVLGGVNDDGTDYSQTIYDFYPLGIGDTCAHSAKGFVRNVALGGNPPCGFGDASAQAQGVFGPNNAGAGWWNRSIWIDVQGNRAGLNPAASRDAPFFSAEQCNDAEVTNCDDPECCGGCDGVPIVQPAHSLGFPGGDTHVSTEVAGSDGGVNEGVLDLRSAVVWHMARVTRVFGSAENPNRGHICYIQLLGNDGAEGGSCSPCQSFAYGTMIKAIGFTGLDDLGTDLTDREPDNFSIGELVTVVGWTDRHYTACLAGSAGWSLIVTNPHGAGQDFTSLFWAQLRCPGFEPVDRYFRDVEYAYAHRHTCEGGPTSVKCGCSRDSQMRCE